MENEIVILKVYVTPRQPITDKATGIVFSDKEQYCGTVELGPDGIGTIVSFDDRKISNFKHSFPVDLFKENLSLLFTDTKEFKKQIIDEYLKEKKP